MKQIYKRNYRNSGKIQKNLQESKLKYISKVRRQHFVKISGSMALPLIWTTLGEGKLFTFNSTNIIV